METSSSLHTTITFGRSGRALTARFCAIARSVKLLQWQPAAYAALQAWMKDNDVQPSDAPWEVYITDLACSRRGGTRDVVARIERRKRIAELRRALPIQSPG